MASTQNTEIPLELIPNREVVLTKNISDGKFLKDLSHLSKKPFSCFSEGNSKHFNGKHLIFKGKVPQYCDVRITIVPKQKGKKISTYAYLIDGETTKETIKNKCQIDYMAKNKMGADILLLNNLKTGVYEKTLVVGVTGSNKLSYADFTIKIYLKSS